jgi:hypothetical protein
MRRFAVTLAAPARHAPGLWSSALLVHACSKPITAFTTTARRPYGEGSCGRRF